MVYILLWNGNVLRVSGSLLEDTLVPDDELDLKPVIYRKECNDGGSAVVTRKVSRKKYLRKLSNIDENSESQDLKEDASSGKDSGSVLGFRRKRLLKTIRMKVEEKPSEDEDDEFGGFCVYNQNIAIFGNDGLKFADLHSAEN